MESICIGTQKHKVTLQELEVVWCNFFGQKIIFKKQILKEKKSKTYN